MQTISETEFTNKISSENITIIDFYADWCGPCKHLLPILESVNSTHESINIYKINIDNSQTLTAKLEITSIPTVIFYKKGIEFFRHSGLLSEEEFSTIISNNEADSEFTQEV